MFIFYELSYPVMLSSQSSVFDYLCPENTFQKVCDTVFYGQNTRKHREEF